MALWQHLKLRHLNLEVKCTDNDIFRVRPPLAFIRPDETASVKVISRRGRHLSQMTPFNVPGDAHHTQRADRQSPLLRHLPHQMRRRENCAQKGKRRHARHQNNVPLKSQAWTPTTQPGGVIRIPAILELVESFVKLFEFRTRLELLLLLKMKMRIPTLSTDDNEPFRKAERDRKVALKRRKKKVVRRRRQRKARTKTQGLRKRRRKRRKKTTTPKTLRKRTRKRTRRKRAARTRRRVRVSKALKICHWTTKWHTQK